MKAGFEEWKVLVFLKTDWAEDRTAHVDRKRRNAVDMLENEVSEINIYYTFCNWEEEKKRKKEEKKKILVLMAFAWRTWIFEFHAKAQLMQ